MGGTAGPSGVRRPPWEVPPSRRPIVQRPSADCEDDPEPGNTTDPERKAFHNDPRLDDTIKPLSYRDIEELFLERGLEVDHSTLNRWVLAYAPLIERRLR